MTFLVAGFYGHGNAGDDMFEQALKLILGELTLEFTELSRIDQVDLSKYQGVLVGGGDLLNDFYGSKYRQVLSKYSGYKAAIGVGISFDSCLEQDYLAVFDDIFIRNQCDLKSLRSWLGTNHVHAIPDLGFALRGINPTVDSSCFQCESSTVGLFLVGSSCFQGEFRDNLIDLIRHLVSRKYHVRIIAMYLEAKTQVNDLSYSQEIMTMLGETENVEISAPQTVDDFFTEFHDLHLGICIKFHAHVFCARFSIPFVSFGITRKVTKLMMELPLECQYQVQLNYDERYQVSSFNVEQCLSLIRDVELNYETIRGSLENVSNRRHEFYSCSKIRDIISRAQKRVILSSHPRSVNPEKIYQKYRDRYLRLGINPSLGTELPPYINSAEVDNLADDLCYELTNEISNDYIYGTRINLRNPTILRNVIDFIYYSNRERLYKQVGPFNISYINQNSFRGLHRAGWQYSIDALAFLDSPYGIYLDTYLDCTFGWAADLLTRQGLLPYTNEWVGFIHHTFDEDFSKNNCSNMFKSKLFQLSLHCCRGLFCLSDYLAQRVRQELNVLGFNQIHVDTLVHPTCFVEKNWTVENYSENQDKMILNIGAWYRNPVSINRLAHFCYSNDHRVTRLCGKRMENTIPPQTFTLRVDDEITMVSGNNWVKYLVKYLNDGSDSYATHLKEALKCRCSDNSEITISNSDELFYEFIHSVRPVATVSDQDYDILLSRNIVFLDLVDASAVNTLIECIVRGTPIIVNKLPAVVELLGEGYPLYYTKIEEVPSLLDVDKITDAHIYFTLLDTEKFRIETFVSAFLESSICKQVIS